jgi:hypothetical protein
MLYLIDGIALALVNFQIKKSILKKTFQDMSPWTSFENVDRRSNLSLEEFITQYGEPNIPVIITDIVPK